MRQVILTLFFSLIVALRPSMVMAQAGSSEDIVKESLNDFYTVAGIGAGGAILGLSTLSFVDDAGDHLKNIVVGAAIGVIVGVGVVAFQQAGKSQQQFYQQSGKVLPDFETLDRLVWHQQNHREHSSKVSESSVTNFSYQFSF